LRLRSNSRLVGRFEDKDNSLDQDQRGCLPAFLAALWIVAVMFVVPVGYERYRAPLLVKLVVTAGHLSAAVALLYPHRHRPIGVWLLCIPFSLFAILGVGVMWFWN
jgi:multidrug efflux pump subunit AcrB